MRVEDYQALMQTERMRDLRASITRMERELEWAREVLRSGREEVQWSATWTAVELEGRLTRAKAKETREVLADRVNSGEVVIVTETGEEESLGSDK